jgi:FkbM family methyltransferase
MEKFILWKNRGFIPKIIFDIGAHTGGWTKGMRDIFSESEYYLFEAFEGNNKYNVEKNYYNIFLSKQDREPITFFNVDAEHTTGNSRYFELTTYFLNNKVYSNTLISKSLDTFVTEEKIPYPDLIKIDVQGSELDILKGGEQCMKHATMILLEVSIHQYNKEAPLFAQVIHYMDISGFEVIDLIQLHNSGTYLIQVDLLFAKKNSGYRLETCTKIA